MKKFCAFVLLILAVAGPAQADQKTVEFIEGQRNAKIQEVLSLRENERSLEESHKSAERKVYVAIGELQNLSQILEKLKAEENKEKKAKEAEAVTGVETRKPDLIKDMMPHSVPVKK